jgi:hypothetical protein
MHLGAEHIDWVGHMLGLSSCVGHIADTWAWGADTCVAHPLYNLALIGPRVCLHSPTLNKYHSKCLQSNILKLCSIFQSVNEMLGMFFSDILDTKVIHHQGELNGACSMAT